MAARTRVRLVQPFSSHGIMDSEFQSPLSEGRFPSWSGFRGDFNRRLRLDSFPQLDSLGCTWRNGRRIMSELHQERPAVDSREMRLPSPLLRPHRRKLRFWRISRPTISAMMSSLSSDDDSGVDEGYYGDDDDDSDSENTFFRFLTDAAPSDREQFRNERRQRLAERLGLSLSDDEDFRVEIPRRRLGSPSRRLGSPSRRRRTFLLSRRDSDDSDLNSSDLLSDRSSHRTHRLRALLDDIDVLLRSMPSGRLRSPSRTFSHQDSLEYPAAPSEPNSSSDGLSKVQIEQLPVVTHSSSKETSAPGKQCTICYQDFVKGDQTRFLPCTHQFHCSCIDGWLQKCSCCPLCRTNVRCAL